MLIIKVKRVNPNIKIMVLAEDETDNTRVLEYGADEFAVKPISVTLICLLAYLYVMTQFMWLTVDLILFLS
jgi:DNA-binding response OmpR family regulator